MATSRQVRAAAELHRRRGESLDSSRGGFWRRFVLSWRYFLLPAVLASAAVGWIVIRSNTDDGSPDATAEPAVTFLPESAHEGLPPNPGCDQLFVHSAMAMWNPSLADELLDYGCPFPFDPSSISMEGGAEDRSIQAPFEPTKYQDIFDVIASEQFGVCAVGRLPEESVAGFVYGFNVLVRAQTCADGDPNVAVTIREYASRAHRDAAANSATGRVVHVLGRFVVSIDGADEAGVNRLDTAIQTLGADRIDLA